MCASVLKCLVSFDRAGGEKKGACVLRASWTQLSLPEPHAPAVVAHLGSLSQCAGCMAGHSVTNTAGDSPGPPGGVLYERGGRALSD